MPNEKRDIVKEAQEHERTRPAETAVMMEFIKLDERVAIAIALIQAIVFDGVSEIRIRHAVCDVTLTGRGMEPLYRGLLARTISGVTEDPEGYHTGPDGATAVKAIEVDFTVGSEGR